MDGDEDNIAGIVSFFNEGDVPDSIKTVCNTGQVNHAGGANISGIVSFLNDGSVPDTIKTLCNIDEVNEGGDEVLCNTQSALSIVFDIEDEDLKTEKNCLIGVN